MKRILLVNPWIHDFAAYDLWMKPLGLLYLAAFLRANDFHVGVIDCLDPYHPDLESELRLRPFKRQPSGRGHFPREAVARPEVLSRVKRRYLRFGISPRIFRNELGRFIRPDLILVASMMTYWYPGVEETIRMLREIFPGAPVVLGGVYATLCTEHAASHSGADEVVAGDGFGRLAELVKKYLDADLAFSPEPQDLDSLPYPAFDLLKRIEQVPLTVSRGCPYRCTYCASSILNPDGFRSRDPFRVVDEIQFWHDRYGVRHFAFYDDALLVNPDASVSPMLKEIIRRVPDCSFHCPNGLHLREMTGPLARLMREAGFKTLRFGFETADVARQLETGGKATSGHLQQAVAYLREAGYAAEEIGVYLLCGLPGQKAGEVRRSIETVLACGARPVLAEYSPLPGTALWEEALRCSPWDLAREPLFHNNTLLPCRDERLSDTVYHELKRLTRSRVNARTAGS